MQFLLELLLRRGYGGGSRAIFIFSNDGCSVVFIIVAVAIDVLFGRSLLVVFVVNWFL